MTKTPEQMAEEYRIWVLENDHREIEKPGGHLSIAFLAGYQAAMNSPEKQDSCEHILDMEKMVDVNHSSGWISVKERLPEEGQMCVVQSNWHGVLLSERIEDRWLLKEDDGYYERPTHWVTYWMPLPKPPEDKE